MFNLMSNFSGSHQNDSQGGFLLFFFAISEKSSNFVAQIKKQR